LLIQACAEIQLSIIKWEEQQDLFQVMSEDNYLHLGKVEDKEDEHGGNKEENSFNYCTYEADDLKDHEVVDNSFLSIVQYILIAHKVERKV